MVAFVGIPMIGIPSISQAAGTERVEVEVDARAGREVGGGSRWPLADARRARPPRFHLHVHAPRKPAHGAVEVD